MANNDTTPVETLTFTGQTWPAPTADETAAFQANVIRGIRAYRDRARVVINGEEWRPGLRVCKIILETAANPVTAQFAGMIAVEANDARSVKAEERRAQIRQERFLATLPTPEETHIQSGRCDSCNRVTAGAELYAPDGTGYAMAVLFYCFDEGCNSVEAG